MGGSTGEAFVQAFPSVNRYWKSSPKRRKVRLTHRPRRLRQHRRKPTTCGIAKRYGFDAVSAVTPFYYPFSLKNTAITIGQLLIRRMVCRCGVQHSSPEWGKTDPGSDQHIVTLPGVGALKQTSGDLYQMSRSVVNILIWCSITVTTKSSLWSSGGR